MGNINIKELNEFGFILYSVETKIGVQKVSTPKNNLYFGEKIFENLNLAEEFIKKLITEQKKVYKAIIRFDRGLGIEYKTIENIRSNDEKEAEKIALENSQLLKNSKTIIAEVKIRQQNWY